jgi:hypothetical protein
MPKRSRSRSRSKSPKRRRRHSKSKSKSRSRSPKKYRRHSKSRSRSRSPKRRHSKSRSRSRSLSRHVALGRLAAAVARAARGHSGSPKRGKRKVLTAHAAVNAYGRVHGIKSPGDCNKALTIRKHLLGKVLKRKSPSPKQRAARMKFAKRYGYY